MTDSTAVAAHATARPATAKRADSVRCCRVVAAQAATIAGARWKVVVGDTAAATPQTTAKTTEPATGLMLPDMVRTTSPTRRGVSDCRISDLPSPVEYRRGVARTTR